MDHCLCLARSTVGPHLLISMEVWPAGRAGHMLELVRVISITDEKEPI